MRQQEHHGIVCVIVYARTTLDAAERQYCTTRKELAAVIHALKEFRNYYVMSGVHLLLRSDHGSLTSHFKVPEPIQQQERYLNFVADYNFEIQHRAGFSIEILTCSVDAHVAARNAEIVRLRVDRL